MAMPYHGWATIPCQGAASANNLREEEREVLFVTLLSVIYLVCTQCLQRELIICFLCLTGVWVRLVV